MTSAERQEALKAIDDLSTRISLQESNSELAMADLLLVARKASLMFEDLATTMQEKLAAKHLLYSIAEAERIITGTAVGV